MLQRICNAFNTHYIHPEKAVEDHSRQIAQGVVMRFSRGNIALQQGRYLMREDIDQRLRKIRLHKFVR